MVLVKFYPVEISETSLMVNHTKLISGDYSFKIVYEENTGDWPQALSAFQLEYSIQW